METRTKREAIAILVFGCILGYFALYGITYARAAVRDDLRKQDLTNIKRSLEQYFNTHNTYLSPPSGKAECTRSSQESWFFGDASPLLKKQFIDAIPHDVRESRGFTYTYCSTVMDGSKTTGFYLKHSWNPTPQKEYSLMRMKSASLITG
jgi:type II secretory pathway pseudopilin PulG